MAERKKRQIRSKTRGVQLDEIENEEVIATVCNYFCRGYSVAQIADLMHHDHGVKMSREVPYRYLQQAAAQGRLKFIAPGQNELSEKIRQQYFWLARCDVVVTRTLDDVAYQGATMLMELLREHRRYPQRIVNIGFAGGNTMQRVAAELANLLKQPADGLPDTLVFHALVAGFDLRQPVTDPSAFFTYLQDPAVQVETEFVALHAPPIIQPDQMETLLRLPGIKEAYQSVTDLDIIVTSAEAISDEHSMLSQYYQIHSPQTIEKLREEGCVGDISWLPVAKHGPIDNNTYPYRSMILIELNKLPSLIERGLQVLLIIGPCLYCGNPKVDILDTILNLPEPLITHLVVDSRTARELYRRRDT